jgi:hypothetical protein
VISRTTEKFRGLFILLPSVIKLQAKQAYQHFKKDPYHPSLQFKRVHSSKPIYSVRVNSDYRAVGIIKDNEIIWFWIGSHNVYDKLLKKL